MIRVVNESYIKEVYDEWVYINYNDYPIDDDYYTTVELAERFTKQVLTPFRKALINQVQKHDLIAVAYGTEKYLGQLIETYEEEGDELNRLLCVMYLRILDEQHLQYHVVLRLLDGFGNMIMLHE